MCKLLPRYAAEALDDAAEYLIADERIPSDQDIFDAFDTSEEDELQSQIEYDNHIEHLRRDYR